LTQIKKNIYFFVCREDILLCRRDWSLHTLIQQWSQEIKAQIFYWDNADDIFNIFVNILHQEGLLDTSKLGNALLVEKPQPLKSLNVDQK
jgi:hypothetical protein